MHAVILHTNGTITPRDIGELARQDAAVWKQGRTPAMYCVLSLCDTSEQALNKAAEMRAEQRERGKQRPATLTERDAQRKPT